MSNLDTIHANMTKSDYYKMKEGSNRMRIVSDFTEVKTINRGKDFMGYMSEKNQPQTGDRVSTQAWAWAIVRGDEKKGTVDELYIVKFGITILGQIVALRNSADYAFDDRMSYDIDIQAKNAGTIDAEYTVIPARQNTEVTETEMADLNKKTTIENIVGKMIEKQDSKDALEKYGKPEYPKATDGNNANAF
jgi:hypothetical protein